MDGQPPAKQSPPHKWPGEWVRDEKFWREVATRTVAGILALAIPGFVAFILLSVAGFLQTPDAWVTVIIGLMVTVLGLFWLALVWGIVYTFTEKDSAYMRSAFVVGALVVGAAITWIIWSVVAG